MTRKHLNEKFINDILAKCKKHGVRVRMEEKKMIFSEGDINGCGGYFSAEDKILAVATKVNSSTLYGLLAHESSHLDQWIENPYLWYKCSYGYSLFFDWLDGKIVKREHLEEAVQDIIRIELDCEIRSLKKIEKYKLPINIIEYRKKANIYFYSFLFMLNSRKWIPKIYSYKPLWLAAPTCLREEYKKIPVRLEARFRQLLALN